MPLELLVIYLHYVSDSSIQVEKGLQMSVEELVIHPFVIPVFRFKKKLHTLSNNISQCILIV